MVKWSPTFYGFSKCELLNTQPNVVELELKTENQWPCSLMISYKLYSDAIPAEKKTGM